MKIKFRALCLTALVAVLAFASVASATQFLGVDSNGKVVVIKIDPTADNPMTYTGYTTGTPDSLVPEFQKAGGLKHLKMYTWEGKYVLISADTSFVAGTNTDNVFFYNVDDKGNVTYDSTHNGTKGISVQGVAGSVIPGTGTTKKVGGYGVTDILTLNDNPVFIADNAISTILTNNDYAFISVDLTSIDTAFVHDSKLYVIHSADDELKAGNKATHISQVKAINSNTTKKDILDAGAAFKKAEVMTPWDQLNAGVYTPYAYDAAVVGDWVYILDSHDLVKFEAKELTASGLIIAGNSPTLQTTNLTDPEYRALTTDGTTLYALKKTTNSYAIVSVSPSDETETFIYDVTEADVGATSSQSFDLYYDPTDKVIAVVNHGGNVAFYVNKGENNWSKVTAKDTFITAAMIASTGSTPDTPDTPATDSTVVDPTSLTDDQKASLKDASGGEAADFVTTATEATGTTPDTTVTANVRSAAGTGYEDATVAAVKNYTLASDGYILVKAAGYNAANVKVFFVPVSTSSATVAADSTSEGVLLDSSYAKITSGTSAFASSAEKLTAGTYTLVTATKTASTTPEDEGSDTGSSSSGCDAGFGLMSLAALLAVTTISKRR